MNTLVGSGLKTKEQLLKIKIPCSSVVGECKISCAPLYIMEMCIMLFRRSIPLGMATFKKLGLKLADKPINFFWKTF